MAESPIRKAVCHIVIYSPNCTMGWAQHKVKSSLPRLSKEHSWNNFEISSL